MWTTWSEEPQLTISPSADHEHLRSVFSRLCCAPSNCLSNRDPVTNGRTSQLINVLSIELVRSEAPSGDRLIPVMVSACPSSVNTTASLLRSHALTTLSVLPVKISSSSALKAQAVTGNFPSTVCTLCRDRRSHTMALPSSPPLTSNGSSPRLKFTELTTEPGEYFFRRFPRLASNTPTVLSADADTIFEPDRFHSRSRIAFLCPSKTLKFSHSP
mmetsp:Transcript_68806/g.155632  ORF Transcript_68806/g.155632 Transcript_68806/m.155632 type:complete len:215 (-) Transcript_68806:293-937(-)